MGCVLELQSAEFVGAFSVEVEDTRRVENDP